MATLADHHSSNLVKMLLLGHSGSGKTGSLASLVSAGYKLRYLDFDNGLDILANILKRKNPKLLTNVEYELFTDTYKPVGAQIMASKVEAWEAGMKKLTEWTASKEPEPDVVIVIDSLTLASRALFNWVLKTNNKLLGQPEIQHWGAAQTTLENFLALIVSDAVKQNIIICSHITMYGEGENDIKLGFPTSSVGRSFSAKIPRYFNSVLMVRSQNNGAKREILTKPTNMIELKNSSPFVVKDSYPIETGIADYFADVTGRKPATPAKA